jgi:peptide/nickel transport system substrate-binding protein
MRTITFHLSKPDPDFLYKLALPFGSVVPAGSPPVGTGARPLPATGPYRILRYVPGREAVLVRNRHFRPWSAVAQPSGFPDRITLRLGLDPVRQAREISAGSADVMLSNPLPGALRRLGRRVPLQLHSWALPEFEGMFLNTRVAPFDRTAVRRALALAVDRAAVVELYGGANSARPACQILPPGFPGHQPFCPYTSRPNAAGVWQSPDVARARSLIARSGTTGMEVVVATIRNDARKRAMGSYLVGVLNDLGYHARLRLYRDHHAYYPAVGLTRNRVQIGVMAWYADYQAASIFFRPLLTCAAYRLQSPSLNLSAFCAPAIDAEIARATSLQAANPAAAHAVWGKIDREVTLRAPLLPLVNPLGVDFVSRRVGNYQRNPAFGILLGRLWIR